MSDDNSFTIKDYDRIIDDIMDEFFAQHDLNYDYKELMKSQLLGSPEEGLPEEIPPIEGGY